MRILVSWLRELIPVTVSVDELAEALSRAVRWMPRSGILAFGRFLGRLVGDIDQRHVDIAADNLRRAFPDWDDMELR